MSKDRITTVDRMVFTLKYWALICAVSVVGGGVLQLWLHSWPAAGGFVLLAGLLSAWQWVFVYRHRFDNMAPDRAAVYRANLGLANWLSMVRGQFTALLLGFVVAPRPEGAWAWLPGGLFLLAALLDLADGYAARMRGEETRLGEQLDQFLDGMAVLAATVVAVRWGQVSGLYLLVGLARYLFLLGIRYRQMRNLAVYELDPRMIRRALAGSQMGFLAVVLLPVFSPPATLIAGTVFMTPFLIHFFRDWLVVSGKITPRPAGQLLPGWVPLLVRGGVVLGLGGWVSLAGGTMMAPWKLGLIGVFILLILAGFAGRITALLILFLLAFAMVEMGPVPILGINLVLSGLLFFSGTGKYSLWTPEDQLISRRAGEPRQP